MWCFSFDCCFIDSLKVFFQTVYGSSSLISISNFNFSILQVSQFSSRFSLVLAVLWTLIPMRTSVLLLWEPVLECPKDLWSKMSKVSYFVPTCIILIILDFCCCCFFFTLKNKFLEWYCIPVLCTKSSKCYLRVHTFPFIVVFFLMI